MKFSTLIGFIMVLLPFLSLAQKQNTANSTWPLEMNSSKNFDIASKCEMLVFVEVFNEYDPFSFEYLSSHTKVKNVNKDAVNKWKKQTKDLVISNFKMLSDNSLEEIIALEKPISWEEISVKELHKKFPSNYLNWYVEAKQFYSEYVNEQIRLAALFPAVTSEVLTLSENEIQGSDYPDKNFILTFDDGPTVANGNTDALIKVLEAQKLKGVFFVLGENLESRLKATSKKSLNDLYIENKVYSHGKVHKSHQKYESWKESINYTNDLIHKIFPTENKDELLSFRPPYGQRNQKVVAYFNEKNSKIIYWNIDSRDWSSKLTAQQVTDRQIKLMLLWRRGILLFHDIHSKAQIVVPSLSAYFKDANIKWMESL